MIQNEELIEFFKSLQPMKTDISNEAKKTIKRTCSNCQDYIVCWGRR